MVPLVSFLSRCALVAALPATAFLFLTMRAMAAPGVLLLEDEAAALTVPPITDAPTARLNNEVRALHHAWAQRVLIAPFTARTTGEPWQRDALTFLETAVDDLGYSGDRKDSKELAAQGQKLLDAGCREPLVRYLAARIAFRETKDAPATTKVLEEVTKQITAEKSYAAALLCFIAKDAYAVRRSTGLTGKGMEKGVGELMKKIWNDGSYGKEDDALFVFHQLDFQWQAMPETRPAAFLEYYGNPAIPEWARNTMQGFCEVALAWEARGGGWANAVKEEGWAGFREHLVKAGAALTQAWEQRPDQPYAAAIMIKVAMGDGSGGEDGVRLWFDRTVAAQFDYFPAYRAVLWAYRPRWGGSHELMFAFGRACRATGRFDTFVPLYFRDAVHDALSETPDQRAYLRARPSLAREMMALDREWIKHPGVVGPAELWWTKLAIDAWCIEDFATVREALGHLSNGITLAGTNLRELRTSAREIVADTELAGTEAAAARAAAELAYAGGDLETAHREFSRAQQLAKGNPAAWLQSRLNIVNFERALAKGDWVRVTGDVGAEWMAMEGEYQAKGGTLSPVGNYQPGLVIFRGRIGENFEMRGVFEIEAPTRQAQNFEVVVDYHPEHATDWMACALYQEAGGMIVAGAQHFHYSLGQGDSRKVVTLEKSNRFFVRVQDGLVTYELNDRPLLDQFRAPETHAKRPQSQIGFASARSLPGNTTVIKEIEVRRLPAAGGR